MTTALAPAYTQSQAPLIQLKKVKTFRGRDGYGLNAELWIDGIKSAYVIDHANGGPFHYDVYNKEKFTKLENHIAGLKETMYNLDGLQVEMKPDMDLIIAEIMDKMNKK